MSLMGSKTPEDNVRSFGVVPDMPPNPVASVFYAFVDSAYSAAPRFEEWMRNRDNDSKIKEITGKEWFQHVELTPEESRGFQTSTTRSKLDDFILTSRQTDERFKEIKTQDEIKSGLYKDAKYYREQAEAESARGASISSFVGHAAGAMIDPVNIAASLTGFGPAKFSVTLGREVLINAATEVVQTPWRKEWEEKLGYKYGLKEIATDVAFAAAGGAAFATVAEGIGRGFKFAKDSFSAYSSRGAEYFDTVATSGKLDAELEASAHHMSRAAHIDELNPIENPTFDDIEIHERNAQEFSDAFREGRQPVLEPFPDQPVDKLSVPPKVDEFEPDLENFGLVYDDPRIRENIAADFERTLKDQPDLLLDTEEGAVSLKEIKMEMDEDMKVIQAIEGCAV